MKVGQLELDAQIRKGQNPFVIFLRRKDKHGFGSDVPMHDIKIVEAKEGWEKLLDNKSRFSLRQETPSLLDKLVQIATISRLLD